MKSIPGSIDHFKKFDRLTDDLFFAYDRWDGDESSKIFKKTVFKNLLADYHSFKNISNFFPDFKSNLTYEFGFADVFLKNPIDSFVDVSFSTISLKNTTVIDSLMSLKYNRKNLLQDIEKFYSTRKLDDKLVITKLLIDWFNAIQNFNSKFFFKEIGVNLEQTEQVSNEISASISFSRDIFLTFLNFMRSKPEKRVLTISTFASYLSMYLWFEDFEVTFVHNKISFLSSLHFSIDQFRDLFNQNIFLPSQNFRNGKYILLYDDELLLKRFNKLENESYAACILDFLFSHDSKPDSNKITIQLNKIKSLLQSNSVMLLQENSVIEEVVDKILSDLSMKVILKVRFIEHIEVTNWLVLVNKS